MVSCFKGNKSLVVEWQKEEAFLRNGGILLEESVRFKNGRGIPIRCFSSSELKRVTNNYDPKQILYQDGTFLLYKGVLRDRAVIVKKYIDSYLNDSCFREIVFASQMSVHKHVLKLLGCCLDTEIPRLVFEYAENGILADHIHNRNKPHARTLLWKERLKITADVAHAVAYLHAGFPRPIVHRNLTPSNILLDKDYNAKLTDFSQSLSIPEKASRITETSLGGFSGFFAPECFSEYGFNEKADVFSFGQVMLELSTGKTTDMMLDFELSDSNAYEPFDNEGIRNAFRDSMKMRIQTERLVDIMDTTIIAEGPWPEKEQQLRTFVTLALHCISHREDDRPTITEVAKQLREMFIKTASSQKFCGSS